jgi:hypothetical protein
LVELEMGLELNGAENVEGPTKGISKDLIEKALVVSSKGEGNTMIGHQDLGPHNS